MSLYIARRLFLLIATLILLSWVSFSLCYYTPHAPLEGATLSDAYLFWLKGMLHFDFGISSINGQPVSEQLLEVFPATLELCLFAGILATLVGLPLGIIAAINRHKWQDKVISGFALVGFSLPVFWLALLLTMLFSLTLGWLPVSGRIDLLYPAPAITGSALVDAWLSHSPHRHAMLISVLRHLVLPVVTLSIVPMTELIRLMRDSTLETINQSYIKAAFIRGLSRFTVVRRHVIHNALPPIVPQLGLQFSTLLTLAMITEAVFNWPGIGRWLIMAVRQADYNAISAGVMTLGSLVILINMLADIFGAIIDPLKHKEWYANR
ncbi:putrescine export ABC transporter permease SapB [Rosenbergiella australiborealis]|uniref:Peptide ABC transporter permease SapB n=1 Tax=Rosenbergiella australiborealis TaxID=1544696 RepID=A0ABS5T3R2_9GAMM|nr:putrescine export ABC transporter permease SapB [Rosenbergiella australiborealis]MBT0726378.1 peptide ABC transporter permease SapB [Rosenbergiella australiborealis]